MNHRKYLTLNTHKKSNTQKKKYKTEKILIMEKFDIKYKEIKFIQKKKYKTDNQQKILAMEII